MKNSKLLVAVPAVIQLALNRATEEVKDIQPATVDANKAGNQAQCQAQYGSLV